MHRSHAAIYLLHFFARGGNVAHPFAISTAGARGRARVNKLSNSDRHLAERHLASGEPSPASAGDRSFTAAVAYDPEIRRSRTVPELAASSSLLYQVQVLASLATFVLGFNVGLLAMAVTLPAILLSQKREEQQPKNLINVSSERGSRTAALALWARSQANLQGSGGPDYLAPRLLEDLSIFGPGIPASARVAIAFCGLLSRINFRLTRGVFEDQAAFVATLLSTGLVTPILVRTCWLDDCVEAFVRSLPQSDEINSDDNEADRGNLVILGSGYDTRCYRLKLKQRKVRTFEVDAPGTQVEKIKVLRKAGIDSSGTTFCPCDFETQDWLDALLGLGFDPSLPTVFVWEGVSMYLAKSTVTKTLRTVSRGAREHNSSWYIGFDYINSHWAMSPVWVRTMERAGEPFKFAMSGSEPEELVQSCGLRLLEHLNDKKELARRYVPRHYNESPIGILGDYGGFVLATVV